MHAFVEAIRARIVEIVATTTVEAIVAGAGVWSDWSAGQLVLALVVAAPCAIWAYYGWLRVQGWKYRPANYKKWRQVKLPALWQAACIYDDIEPYLPVREGTPCYPTLQMIKSEALAGRIKFITEEKNLWERVRQEDLRAIAEHNGDRPKCLFSEDGE